jgi:hypothetical protein
MRASRRHRYWDAPGRRWKKRTVQWPIGNPASLHWQIAHTQLPELATRLVASMGSHGLGARDTRTWGIRQCLRDRGGCGKVGV